jgi:hypothetical protein
MRWPFQKTIEARIVQSFVDAYNGKAAMTVLDRREAYVKQVGCNSL